MSNPENQPDPNFSSIPNELIMVRKYLTERRNSHGGSIARFMDQMIYIIDVMLPVHTMGPWEGAHQELRIAMAKISLDLDNVIQQHQVPWITDLGFLQEIANLLKPYCEPKVELDSITALLKGLGRMQFYWSGETNASNNRGSDPDAGCSV